MLAGCDGWRLEHYYKPAQHELGWAGLQKRAEQAIGRRWHRVRLAVTFSLLAGRPPDPTTLGVPAAKRPGGNQAPGSFGRRHSARCGAGCAPGRACRVLAEWVHGPATARTRCTPGARRPFPAARRPNLTNQRLVIGSSTLPSFMSLFCQTSRRPDRSIVPRAGVRASSTG